MHIGFDAKRLFYNDTGLGNYSRTLVHNLTKYFPEHDYYLLAAHGHQSKYADNFLGTQLVNQSSIKNTISRSFWLRSPHRLDIYHGLSNEVPIFASSSTRKVVTIHDLFYKVFPQDFSYWDKSIYHYKTKISCSRADHIIAISQATKGDIINYLNVPEEKIKVIYQSCNPVFIEPAVTHPPPDLPEKYMLYVGSINNRKNLIGVIDAIAQLTPDNRLPLVIVGTGSETVMKAIYAKIDQHNLTPLIHFCGDIDNHTLKSYYEHAHCTILASFYEGFGIPVLESLHCGTPVIVSNVSALPEVAGKAGLLVNPENSQSIAAAIINIQKPNVYQNLQDNIPAQLAIFEPRQLTKQLVELYQSLM